MRPKSVWLKLAAFCASFIAIRVAGSSLCEYWLHQSEPIGAVLFVSASHIGLVALIAIWPVAKNDSIRKVAWIVMGASVILFLLSVLPNSFRDWRQTGFYHLLVLDVAYILLVTVISFLIGFVLLSRALPDEIREFPAN